MLVRSLFNPPIMHSGVAPNGFCPQFIIHIEMHSPIFWPGRKAHFSTGQRAFLSGLLRNFRSIAAMNRTRSIEADRQCRLHGPKMIVL
jgi:hypothetical protein